MSAHTPGPWRAFPSVWLGASTIAKDDGIFRVEDVATETVICARRTPWPAQAEIMAANARLIAAAPAMHDYIAKRAAGGDTEAAQILESIKATGAV